MVVAANLPEKLNGVRDGFRRYFHEGLEQPAAVSVISEALATEGESPLPFKDGDILALARQRALGLETIHGDRFGFCVGVEAGLAVAEAGLAESSQEPSTRHFVHCWAVVRGLGDEAWGSSGMVQLPNSLIAGLDNAEIPFVIPGRRRSGGMVSSLTGGLENRRSAAELATFHALSSLMYGYMERHPHRRGRRH